MNRHIALRRSPLVRLIQARRSPAMTRMPPIVVLVAGIAFSMNGLAAAQGNSQKPPDAPANKASSVQGSGTLGTVPVWNGTTSLGDSHIQSGTQVTVNVPLQVSGTVFGSGVKYGVSGTASGPLDPNDFCCV